MPGCTLATSWVTWQKTNTRNYFNAIVSTVEEVIQKGGRSDESDLFGMPGGYHRKMDKDAVGTLCQECGHLWNKSNTLGVDAIFAPPVRCSQVVVV